MRQHTKEKKGFTVGVLLPLVAIAIFIFTIVIPILEVIAWSPFVFGPIVGIILYFVWLDQHSRKNGPPSPPSY